MCTRKDKQTVSQEVGAGKRCDRVKVSAAVEAGHPLWSWHRALGEWGGAWLGGGWQQDREWRVTPATGPPGSKLQPRCGCAPGPAPSAVSGDQWTGAWAPLRRTKGRTGKPLTLYSADTPRSVSRSELQGNCPVTLYTFTEKLGDKGTEL